MAWLETTSEKGESLDSPFPPPLSFPFSEGGGAAKDQVLRWSCAFLLSPFLFSGIRADTVRYGPRRVLSAFPFLLSFFEVQTRSMGG